MLDEKEFSGWSFDDCRKLRRRLICFEFSGFVENLRPKKTTVNRMVFRLKRSKLRNRFII